MSVTTVTLVPSGALVVSVTVPVFRFVVVVVVVPSGFFVVVVMVEELEPPPEEDPPPEGREGSGSGVTGSWGLGVHLAYSVKPPVTGALKS